jgi:chromosome partitioning protein
VPVVAVSNQKGGVGKTTSTLNLGAALQSLGRRVLLVDLDPQGNLTTAAGLFQPETLSPSIGDLVTQAARFGGVAPDARGAIIQSPAGLPIIPANSQLSAAELALVSAIGRETVLQSVLEALRADYDYILMDCLPSLSLLVVNAFTAADGLIIPVQADFLAMQGLAQVMETISAVQRRLNPQLRIYGILMTMVDPRTSHSREVVSTIREAFAGQINVFQAEVRLQVGLKDSTKAGMSIHDFDRKSSGAQAYARLAQELIAIAEATPRAEPGASTASAPMLVPTPGPAIAVTADATVAAEGPERRGAAAAVEVRPARRSGRTQPLRFGDLVAGRDGWLGDGE